MALFEEAKALSPGGVMGIRRPYNFVRGEYPIFIERGYKGHIVDVDGNDYIDMLCAYGPIILGYDEAEINEAVKAQMDRRGFCFSLVQEVQNKLERRLTGLIPCAEQAILVKTGSDATSLAVRIARGYTGRRYVLRCGYHVGGFLGCGSPNAILRALARAPARRLTLVCNDTAVLDSKTGRVTGVAPLIPLGVFSKVIVSHIGTNPETQRLMNSGGLEVQLVPQGTLAERIRAAGCGLGGILTPTGVGTEVEEGKRVIVVGERAYLLELPLFGDIAFIKAKRADRAGNLVYAKTARNFNPLMAMACAMRPMRSRSMGSTLDRQDHFRPRPEPIMASQNSRAWPRSRVNESSAIQI